jgi:hypothetical protein
MLKSTYDAYVYIGVMRNLLPMVESALISVAMRMTRNRTDAFPLVYLFFSFNFTLFPLP